MKKINYLIGGMFFLLILLSGCSRETPDKSTLRETSVQTAETPEESEKTTQDIKETEEETKKTVSDEFISGAEETEPLVSVMWRQILESCGDRVNSFYDNENFQQELEEHLWKQWDEDYDIEAYLTNISGEKRGRQSIYVFYGTDVGWATTWRWLDEVEVTPELYTEIEKYWIRSSYAELKHYSQSHEDYSKELIENSLLRVSGSIQKTSYDKGTAFIDQLYPYYYSGIWGSVLKETGMLYEEQTGTVLGSLVGQAYMMEFDLETLVGTFWVCREEAEPIQMKFMFASADCNEYEFEIIEDAVWGETVKDDAWLSFEFDLVTELPVE